MRRIADWKTGYRVAAAGMCRRNATRCQKKNLKDDDTLAGNWQWRTVPL